MYYFKSHMLLWTSLNIGFYHKTYVCLYGVLRYMYSKFSIKAFLLMHEEYSQNLFVILQKFLSDPVLYHYHSFDTL